MVAGKSTPAKVETYTRWSLQSFGLVEIFWLGPLAFGEVPAALAWSCSWRSARTPCSAR